MPLWELIHEQRPTSFGPIRSILAELTEELIAASCDGTLPEQLCMSSVWVDQQSQVKLLDFPIASVAETTGEENGSKSKATTGSPDTPADHPVELLKQIAHRIISTQEIPSHADEFLRELLERDNDLESLEWARTRLNEISERSTSWFWDDRMGLLSVSVAIESGLYFTFCFLASMLLVYAFQLAGWPNFVLMLGIVWLLTGSIGYAFRGGPVFRICGVDVRTSRTRQLASRIRCGLRNVVSWFLPTLGFCLFGYWISTMLAQGPFSPSGDAGPSQLSPITFMVMTFIWMVPIFVQLCLCIFSVVNPHRGVSDYVVGTYLVPK